MDINLKLPSKRGLRDGSTQVFFGCIMNQNPNGYASTKESRISKEKLKLLTGYRLSYCLLWNQAYYY